jgi:hypothetical protein
VRVLSAAILCASLLVLNGCASMTGSPAQSVSMQARDQAGNEVVGAACELTNNKGKWFITTPGSATIVRSNDDMQVLCNKPGHQPGRAAVVSAIKGAMFGNILLGGGIGALIDHNSGAAYEYPSFIQVLMGQSIRIEPPSGDTPQQTEAGTPATTPSQTPAKTVATPASALQPTSMSGPSGASQSTEDRLKELKRLHEAGLITNEVYLDQQKKALESR